MRKFIKNLFIAAILPLFLMAIALIFFIQSEQRIFATKIDFMDVIIDKHRKANKFSPPRIFICGGSNVAFGINSKLIEDSLKIPTINLGIHAGLGIDFMLNEVSSLMKSGDIVILSFEYYLEYEGNKKLQKLATRNFPEAKKYFHNNIIEDFFNYLKYDFKYDFLNFIQNKKLSEDIAPNYQRVFFNSDGDYVIYPQHYDLPNFFREKPFGIKKWSAVDEINKFVEEAKNKNVKVFYSYPPYPASLFKNDSLSLQRHHEDLQNSLKLKFLGKPSDYVFADTLFFDSRYHLNPEGKKLRSQSITKFLKYELQ